MMIVDDQQIIRQGLAGMLGSEPGLALVGAAENGTEAVRLAPLVDPDIILMDLRMPKMNGVEAIRRIRKLCPGAKFIILTVYNNDESIFEGICAGAKAFLMKDVSRKELIEAIRSVHEGKSVLAPEITSMVLDRFAGMAEGGAGSVRLSERESEVMELVGRGLSNKEIASCLKISEHTVKSHVTNIFGKLNVRDRAEAVAKAIQKGWLKL